MKPGRNFPQFLVLLALSALSAGAQQLTPGSVWFGSEPTGQAGAASAVTLTNLQSTPLAVYGVVVPPGDFSETDNCQAPGGGNGLLAPGQSCVINLVFTPQATGMRSGVLKVGTSAAPAPQVLSLGGIGVQAAQLAPSGLWFGQQPAGVPTSPQTVTLSYTNLANAPLTVSNIAASGDYAVTASCLGGGAVLPPGSACPISVTFTPTAPGRRTGTLTVSDSQGTQSIPLAGTGTHFSLSVTPQSALVAPGQTLQLAVSGANAAGGAVSWAVNGTPGGSASVGTVTPAGLYTAPAAAGVYSVSATSTSNPSLTATAQITVGTAAVVADFGSHLNSAYPVPANFLGAGLGGGLRAPLINPIAQAGLQYTRFHAYMQDVYAHGTPDWTYFDSELSAFRAAGMKVILEMDYTPASLQPTANPCPSGRAAYHAMPTDLNAFAAMAASYVSHVDSNFPGVVTDYEVWNEPDGGGLCAGDNSQAAKLHAYLSLYAAVAPALRAAATQDGVQIRIGGPTLGAPLENAGAWIPALLSDPRTSPYVDFLSMHYYISNPAEVAEGLSWSGGPGPSLLSETQDPIQGLAAVYRNVATLARSTPQAGGAPIPVYLDEYNENWGFVNDCCRNDPTYGPLWNSLAIVDLLNSVYSGAPAAPAKMLYYAISNPPFCLLGQIDSAMDCSYPYSSPASLQPYPQYYALELFASANFLGLNGGAYLANSVTSGNPDLQTAAFYTPSSDTVVLVNTSGNSDSVGVLANNPGVALTQAAQATVYVLGSGSPQIATETAPLTQAGAGLQATVSVPPHSVVAVSVPVTPQ